MIQNAKIESTFLGIEDHGILTYNICMAFGTSRQWFGGRVMNGVDGVGQVNNALAVHLRAILETLDVSVWEKLPGTYCRIDGDFTRIRRIGNIIEDKWFDPEDYVF